MFQRESRAKQQQFSYITLAGQKKTHGRLYYVWPPLQIGSPGSAELNTRTESTISFFYLYPRWVYILPRFFAFTLIFIYLFFYSISIQPKKSVDAILSTSFVVNSSRPRKRRRRQKIYKDSAHAARGVRI